jgi:hemolysin activation/secretion protein
VNGREFVLQSQLAVRKGLDGLGASPDGAPLASRLGGRPEALDTRASVTLLAPLTNWLSLYGRATGQWSAEPLLSYEQFAVGNLTIGRGYDPATFTGDSGLAGTVELRAGPFQINPRAVALPYVFFDDARVYNHRALEPDRSARSDGFGAQFRLVNRLAVDLSYARPFDPIAAGQRRPPPQVYLSLTASFL